MPPFTKRLAFVVVVILGFAVGGSPLLAQNAAPASNAPYLNPSLPIDQRVNDLISRMTLEEKASQLVNQARAIPRLAGACVRLVERVAARRGGERNDGVS